MYLCPNCGAEIRFDISSQLMFCEHCDSSFEPTSLEQRGEADYNEASSGFFETEIFECPDCGGEITALPGAMADFCPYCGASVMLEGRQGQMKKPLRIIPFKKTKEECRNAFTAYAKSNWFAPKGYTDGSASDDFRGIYMPYWKYYIHMNGSFSVDTWEHLSKRTRDYKYYDQYKITGQGQSRASGGYHDAASNMADDVSEAIEPFQRRQEQNFHSAYMAGFYADMDDVPNSVYGRVAAKHGRRAIDSALTQQIRNEANLKGSPVSGVRYSASTDSELAMYPVWFMARRIGRGKNNTRVCYSAVNGQTGKVTADLPVDMKKVAIVWLVLTAILTAALGLLYTIRPMQLMADSCLIAIISAVLYYRGLQQVRKKEFRTGDLGFMVKNPDQIDPRAARKNERYRNRMMTQIQRTGGDPESIPEVAPENGCLTSLKKVFFWTFVVIVGFALIGPILTSVEESSAVRAAALSRLFSSIGIFVVTILGIAGLFVKKGVRALRSVHGSLWLMISVWICFAVRMYNPHADELWYIASIVAGLACALSFLELLKVRNLLSTHPMPQFSRADKGGGANA